MIILCLLLLGAIAISSWRVFRGPSMADRLLGVQVIGTTSIGLLLLLAQWKNSDALIDVALVLSVLGAAIVAALVQRLRRLGVPNE